MACRCLLLIFVQLSALESAGLKQLRWTTCIRAQLEPSIVITIWDRVVAEFGVLVQLFGFH